MLAIALAAVAMPRGGNLQQLLFHLLPDWLGPRPFVSLVYSVLFVVACAAPLVPLYRRKIFLKL